MASLGDFPKWTEFPRHMLTTLKYRQLLIRLGGVV
ncbi:unnamed protein product, partial [marine sediment metagenome]